MTEISRSALFGRLNQTALKAVETATGFCKMRGNPYVELVHWIHVLVQDPQNDISAISSGFGLMTRRSPARSSPLSTHCRAGRPRSAIFRRRSKKLSKKAGSMPRSSSGRGGSAPGTCSTGCSRPQP